MPKYSGEMEDKIVSLFEQGKINSVISRELSIDRGALPSRRKAWEKRKQEQEKTEPEKEEKIRLEQPLEPLKYARSNADELPLSDIALIRLKQIHALIGANSMDEMVEAVYADQLAADKYRVEYMESMKEDFPEAEAPKTFAGIFAEEDGYAADLKHDLDVSDKGFQEDQKLIEDLKAKAEEQYEEGYQKGKNDHALLFPCRRCGEPGIILPGTEIHRLVVDFLVESGIVHDDCLPRYERIYVP